MALLAGCKKGAGSKTAAKPEDSNESLLNAKVAVEVGSGHMDGFRDSPSRERTYTVYWKSGSARAADEQHYDLTLKGVSGTLYRDGAPAADFYADTGTAVKATNLLTLAGNVKVVSADKKSKTKGASVSCHEMLYNTTDQILKASGNVTIAGDSFSFGPFADVWCSNDLSEVASPSEFVPVRHNQPSAILP